MLELPWGYALWGGGGQRGPQFLHWTCLVCSNFAYQKAVIFIWTIGTLEGRLSLHNIPWHRPLYPEVGRKVKIHDTWKSVCVCVCVCFFFLYFFSIFLLWKLHSQTYISLSSNFALYPEEFFRSSNLPYLLKIISCINTILSDWHDLKFDIKINLDQSDIYFMVWRVSLISWRVFDVKTSFILIMSHYYLSQSQWLSWMHVQLEIRRLRVWPPLGWQHPFEIDHEIFSMVHSPFLWFKKGSCQFLVKECAQYWLTA